MCKTFFLHILSLSEAPCFQQAKAWGLKKLCIRHAVNIFGNVLFTHFSFKLFSSQLNCILIKAVYGNMNLPSRDDVEDNIMRLESREVAEELLGMA